MVYAAAYCPRDAKDILAKEGYADSKALTDAQREKLFTAMRQAQKLYVGTHRNL